MAHLQAVLALGALDRADTSILQIACYKNSVRAWRTGAQTDLSEVIQVDNIFTNVSKGAVAPSDDLQKAFGTTDVQEIMMQILKKGELQVGEKERAVELEDLRREICTEVAARCVDPNTQRPHTVGMIEKAMNEVGYNVQGNKAAKAQVRYPFCSGPRCSVLTCTSAGPRPDQGAASEEHAPDRARPDACPDNDGVEGRQAHQGQGSAAHRQG